MSDGLEGKEAWYGQLLSNIVNKLTAMVAIGLLGVFAGQYLVRPDFNQPTQGDPQRSYLTSGTAEDSRIQSSMIGVAQNVPMRSHRLERVPQSTGIRLVNSEADEEAIRSQQNLFVPEPNSLASPEYPDFRHHNRNRASESNQWIASPRETSRNPIQVASLPSPTQILPAVIGAITLPTPYIHSIQEGDVDWGREEPLLKSNSFQFTIGFQDSINGLAQSDVAVVSSTDDSAIRFSGPTTEIQIGAPKKENLFGPFSVTGNGTGRKRFEIKIVRPGVAESKPSPPQTILFPSATARITRLAASNNKYGAMNAISSGTGKISIHEGYMKIEVNAVDASSVGVALCEATGRDEALVYRVIQRQFTTFVRRLDGSGSFSSELHVPSTLAGKSGQLLVYAFDSNGAHSLAADAVQFQFNSNTDLSSRDITLGEISPSSRNGLASAQNSKGYFNQSPLFISGSLLASDANLRAVLMIDGTIQGTTGKTKQELENTPFEWSPPRADTFRIEIGVVQGDRIVARSEPRTIHFRQTGPRPTGISPTNLAETPGVNSIKVSFNAENPLDRNSLRNEHFSLLNSSGETGPTVRSFSLLDGNIVLLVFNEIPPGAYTLEIHRDARVSPAQKSDKKEDAEEINMSLVDIYGNALGASSNRNDDTDEFRFDVIKPVGSELPSEQTAGLKNFTGPYVSFPEFTKPRESTVGFNPSDKVVTKVSRLYYYRDAHRVVQIINRGARSYNRQAVDMQQQLADNARRDAENMSDDRRKSEQSAIRAAQRARSAETALNQFQQALVTARKELDRTTLAANNQEDVVSRSQEILTDAMAEQQAVSEATTNITLTLEQQTIVEAALPENQEQLRNKYLDENRRAASQRLARAKTAVTSAQRDVDTNRRTFSRLQIEQTKAASQVADTETHVRTILSEIQVARTEEAEKRDDMERLQQREERLFEDLFRREVAAAHEDPDTYVPGKPNSQDPIEQVSLSVIGEGLIQLRGPLKGVNLARTLINQIDAPVGQVKVAIHTVQVNGEHGKRMEPVIGRIQRYIDHSRFLTTQSAQMLRNAVTLVASRHADEAMRICEGGTQADRNVKYIEAFFGKEFLNELSTLDSEFLHTGNKLLSLHSMDSTSLANALFLLSLAKNDVRNEILTEFERMVQCQLPTDEVDYFTASNEKYKFGPMFHKQKFQFLGQNAKFVSLRGFFNAEVAGSDTLSPMQREFIRLAQIFKSRLVTEIELQQRIMERSLIEERIQNSESDRQVAKSDEDQASYQLKSQQIDLTEQRALVVGVAQHIEAIAETVRTTAEQTEGITEFYDYFWKMLCCTTGDNYDSHTKRNSNLRTKYARTHSVTVDTIVAKNKNCKELKLDSKSRSEFIMNLIDLGRIVKSIDEEVSDFNITSFDNYNRTRSGEKIISEIANLRWLLESNSSIKVEDLQVILQNIVSQCATYQSLGKHFEAEAGRTRNDMYRVIELLEARNPNVREAYKIWVPAKARIDVFIKRDNSRFSDAYSGVVKAHHHFTKLLESVAKYDLYRQLAEYSRRPLDHKKFLDMLIDDAEDKFIELLEGTRAHTANIDNYLSRLGQALEDDFNTQFYHPAFKGIREASRFWDVNLGQIESTSVLTNNRMFAKVSPQATMEFDLPKRDILIREAFESAQAAYDDYGALLGDPTFLSLAKMYRGQPSSALFGNNGPNPTTRNVLPGLPSSTDERLVAQAGAVAPDFPSALESLIPDPAIYKFETGTGYEIRPVIQPDGQAVVFHFNYMYTTNVREPVRADEKHLGRVKRHFIDTDVQTGNYEMREVSRYQVALKASRTARGVPLLEDIPVAGVLFRPLPNQESSIQENIILAQTAIFPTLFDLMGLRWAPVVADMDALRLQEADFVTRSRQRVLRERVFDFASQQVDDFMRIPPAERRSDLYRSQETTPLVHPNGYPDLE